MKEVDKVDNRYRLDHRELFREFALRGEEKEKGSEKGPYFFLLVNKM